MGNSPSFGLGGGATRSSRDMRMRDPEKEVERPPASRAPTHNEYVELPASQKPHTVTNLIYTPRALFSHLFLHICRFIVFSLYRTSGSYHPSRNKVSNFLLYA